MKTHLRGGIMSLLSSSPPLTKISWHFQDPKPQWLNLEISSKPYLSLFAHFVLEHLILVSFWIVQFSAIFQTRHFGLIWFILWVAWFYAQGIRILCTFDTDPHFWYGSSPTRSYVLYLGIFPIVKCSTFSFFTFYSGRKTMSESVLKDGGRPFPQVGGKSRTAQSIGRVTQFLLLSYSFTLYCTLSPISRICTTYHS